MAIYRRRRAALRPRSKATRRPRYYRRRAMRRSGPKGSMFIVRKVKPLHTSNSLGVIGSYVVQEANNTLTLGIPIAQTGGTGIYDVPFSLQFQLDELQSSVELTSLFDNYRIVSAKVKVQTTYTTANNVTTPQPYIDYVQDHDDAGVPTVSAMREKMGVRTKYFSSTRPSITMGVRPVPAGQLYNGIATAGYATPKRSPFINMSTTSVPHYGIKGIIRNLYLPAQVNSSFLTWDVSLGVVCKDIQ